MVNVLVIHKVADYDKWKGGFDSVYELRKKSGELDARVYRGVHDQNEVEVMNRWSNMEDAKKFFSSEGIRDAMKNAGVIGKPEIYFLN
jgi:heme-degrading monooxygenase HmoA